MVNLHQMRPNESLDKVTLPPVSRLDLIRYAGASGDYNPIHTIDEEAEKAGLPGIIAHGMWTMGSLSTLFTPYLEIGFVQDYTIRFKNMVFLGDVLTVQATLTGKVDDALVFQVDARNKQEKVVIEGEVVFKLYNFIHEIT